MPFSHILYAQTVAVVCHSSCRSRELTIREKYELIIGIQYVSSKLLFRARCLAFSLASCRYVV